MGKRTLFAAFCLVCFALIGCDDKDSSQAKEYDLQMALDDGDYDYVLAETQNCGSDQTCLLNRAAAYMGKAGFDAPTIASALLNDDDGKGYFTRLETKDYNAIKPHIVGAKNEYSMTLTARGYSTDSCSTSKGVLNHAEKTACANYSLAAIAGGAAIANQVDKLMKKVGGDCTANTVAACIPTGDQGAVVSMAGDMVDLVFNDTETILGLIDGGDSDTRKEVEKVKNDICKEAHAKDVRVPEVGCNAAEVKGVGSFQDAVLKYINEKR